MNALPPSSAGALAAPGTTDPPSPWKRSADRDRERELKREAVLRTAAQVFNEKGFHAASLDEVAERLHVTRPTLYYYFKSKDEILFECVRLGLERLRHAIADTERSGGSALQKLVSCMHAYAQVVTQDFGMCLVRVGEEPLMPESRERLRALKADIDREFRRLIADGVAEGALVAPDPRLSAFTVAGAISWIARWYRSDGPLAAQDVAEQTIALLLNGLLARPTAVAPPAI